MWKRAGKSKVGATTIALSKLTVSPLGLSLQALVYCNLWFPQMRRFFPGPLGRYGIAFFKPHKTRNSAFGQECHIVDTVKAQVHDDALFTKPPKMGLVHRERFLASNRLLEFRCYLGNRMRLLCGPTHLKTICPVQSGNSTIQQHSAVLFFCVFGQLN